MADLRSDLPRMVVLSRVVALGSFTAAAKELGLSRPAVSAAIAALETSLGVTLLHRTTRTLRPSAVGEAFLARCTELTALASEAVSEVVAASEHAVGTLRVTSPGGILAERLVVPALARLSREHGIPVDLRCSDARRSLVEGGFDASIRVGRPSEAGLVMRRIGRCDEILVATPGLAARVRRPAQLERLPWVCHAELPHTFTLHTPPRRAFTLTMRPVAVVDDNTALFGLVRAGAGAGLVVRLLAEDALASGQLVHLLPEWRARTMDVFVLLPSAKRIPRRVKLLIEVLREQLQG
jgi:DNA-binding transcriptional LysR family regulator